MAKVLGVPNSANISKATGPSDCPCPMGCPLWPVPYRAVPYGLPTMGGPLWAVKDRSYSMYCVCVNTKKGAKY